MRVLVCTQAVDKEDRALGFFHRWLEEMAHAFTRVEVICLKEGQHALPGNIAVHSLGKPHSAEATQGAGRRLSQLKYVANFYRHAWRLRREYDAVFVHMNQEYVLMGGLFWRVLGKRVVMWRNHKMGNRLTDVACMLAHEICYTSPESYVAQKPHAHQMPIGIDTALFRLPAKPASPDTVLFLGRLDPVKKPEVFLAAVDLLARKGLMCRVHGYGDPTDPSAQHVAALQELIPPLEERGILTWHSGVSHDQTPAIYASHGVYVNITPSGSFDKTIGEAMASGCVVVAANRAVETVVPDSLMVSPDSFQDVARGIEAALMLREDDREAIIRRSVAFIDNQHSLKALVARLVKLLR